MLYNYITWYNIITSNRGYRRHDNAYIILEVYYINHERAYNCILWYRLHCFICVHIFYYKVNSIVRFRVNFLVIHPMVNSRFTRTKN